MPEVLIKARVEPGVGDAGAPGVWQPGDPVLDRPEGHPWGTEEGPPKFIVLSLPNLSRSEARGLARRREIRHVEWMWDGELITTTEERVRRRRWRVDLTHPTVSHGASRQWDALRPHVSRPSTGGGPPAREELPMPPRETPIETVSRSVTERPDARLPPGLGGDPEIWAEWLDWLRGRGL